MPPLPTQLHSLETPIQTQGPPNPFIRLSTLFFVFNLLAGSSLPTALPTNSLGTLPLDVDRILLSFLKPLPLQPFLPVNPPYLSVNHQPAEAPNIRQPTATLLWYPEKAKETKEWNNHPTKTRPDINTYNHLNHANARWLDTNTNINKDFKPAIINTTAIMFKNIKEDMTKFLNEVCGKKVQEKWK